ncbi:MAG TPA: flagellar protein FliT [Gaiellaceae bacterium]|jgi:hypothetical protein|nr:flagellar protein FliT [Gaiellaceae bacterium]
MSWELFDELAAREETAVAGRRWDELLEIQAERRRVLDALPADLPQEAKPTLERALARSQETAAVLVAAMAETKGTIERLRGGRRVVGAYQRSGRAA